MKKEGHDGLFTCPEGFRFHYKKHRELCPIYVAAWMGVGFGGEWIHVYVWLRPFTAHLKLSQHCSSAVPQYKIKHLKFEGEKKASDLYQTKPNSLSPINAVFSAIFWGGIQICLNSLGFK